MFVFQDDYRLHPHDFVECPYCRQHDKLTDQYKYSICFYCNDEGKVKTKKLQFHQDYWIKVKQIIENMQHIPFEQFRRQYFVRQKNKKH